MKKMGKKTVAIIGETGNFCPALIKVAVQQDLRLLFISRDQNQDSAVKEQLGKLGQIAEVEFLTCEKEGCWEADVIAFTRPDNIEPVLLKRIKQVATQKLVLVITGKNQESAGQEKFYFRELLPHSKVVELKITDEEFSICGSNQEATETVRDFLRVAGFNQKSELWK